MVRAYSSYSLPDKEDYFMDIFGDRLKEQGCGLTFSSVQTVEDFDERNKSAIARASIFIGLLSSYDTDNDRVYMEWKYALTRNIPAILLVEDKTDVSAFDLSLSKNIVFFSRTSPDEAINFIKNKVDNARPKPKTSIIDTIAWILGGLAIMDLLRLLQVPKPSQS